MENNLDWAELTRIIRESPAVLFSKITEQTQKINKDEINQLIFDTIKIILKDNNIKLFHSFLPQIINFVSDKMGVQYSYNLLLRLEAAQNIRKPSIAIFDHTIHIIGGGQKYGLTIAQALQKNFEITIIANKEITHKDFYNWYNLDLSNCKIKIIRIPFFEKSDSIHIDPGKISKRIKNPFHIISKESGNYDIFINNSMNEMVYPLANISMLICHFPERRPRSYFYSDKYNYVIYNSKYTAHWIEKKWKFSPHKHIYPPVDMKTSAEDINKTNIILSVSRFETSGSKKQLEMVRAFLKLRRRIPNILKDWKLVLVGGSYKGNTYLKKIEDILKVRKIINIETKVNVSVNELKELYRKSKIFWHLCGIDQTDPSLVEHFGMTIVEAMQNRLVPIVFDGGGQREIVEQRISGFRVKTTAELINNTIKLIKDPELLKKLRIAAHDRSKFFTREKFEKNVKSFFNEVITKYISI